MDDSYEDLLSPPPPARQVRAEPWPRRIRAFFNGVLVADSTRCRLLLASGRLPVYYFPPDDVRNDLLERSDRAPRQSAAGLISHASLRVGERVAANAAYLLTEPAAKLADLAGHVAFHWPAIEAWFEEDDQVFVHPRDPFHRVDVLHSSRHVRVELAGAVLAETRQPRLLFETQLPVRYYIPRVDVRMELLTPSDTTTQCPYKGIASYWSARIDEQTYPDIAWCYQFPIPECPKIEGLVSFFNERVDLRVDDVLQDHPRTPWS